MPEKAFDYVFRPDVQEIFDHFCALFGIRIAFFSPAGEELRVGGGQSICRYCKLLRQKLGGEAACRREDEAHRREAVRRGGLVAYGCHGGMREAVMPVYALERLVGFVMIGQYRRRREVPAAWARAWAGRRGDAALAEAYAETPFLTGENEAHVLKLFEALVRFIAAEGLVRVKEHTLLQSVLARMRETVDRPLSLAEAAAEVHRSPGTLSRLFRKVLGKSYKSVQIDMRLQRAEALLRDDPDLTVREAAGRLGFTDPLYFSRLYRRYRGIPPSRFRQTRCV